MPRFARCGRRVQCPFRHQAGRDDADIAALAQDASLTDLEPVVLAQHDRHLAAQLPHIDRPLVLGRGARRRLDLDRIARIDDHEVRDHPHERQVLDRLVGPAIAGGQTWQTGDDLDVEL